VSAVAIAWGTLLGVGVWSVVVGVLPARRQRLVDRLAPYLLDVSEGARAIYRERIDDPMVVFGSVVSPALARVVRSLDRLTGGSDALPGGAVAPGQYRLQRVVSGVIGCAIGALAAAALGIASGSLPLVGLVAASVAGFVGGIWVVDYRRRVAHRVRVERVGEEFPTVLEMLGLALAAGDSLPRAIARVSERSIGELGREWAVVMREVELGASLSVSLRESAGRIGNPRVVAFVEHLAQCLERGAPLGEVVAAHAEDAKDDYTRGLVDKAGKAEVRMLVPMVLLILPVTVIFAVWPGLQALEFGVA